MKTIKIHGVLDQSWYGTVEMRMGDRITINLDDGRVFNFSTATGYLLHNDCETDAMRIDLRDLSFLDD